MVKRFGEFLSWFIQSFGPLIVFLIVKSLAGLKPAIVATIAWFLVEIAYVVAWKRQKPTQFFYFSVGTTLVFGLIDLYSDNPILFRYEAILTNILTGIYFGSTLFVGKPLIQEFAEKADSEKVNTPEARIYLRFLTIIWAGSFIVKALIYLFLANSDMSIEHVTVIRSTVGPVSFLLLLGGERIFRSQLIRYFEAFGLFSKLKNS